MYNPAVVQFLIPDINIGVFHDVSCRKEAFTCTADEQNVVCNIAAHYAADSFVEIILCFNFWGKLTSVILDDNLFVTLCKNIFQTVKRIQTFGNFMETTTLLNIFLFAPAAASPADRTGLCFGGCWCSGSPSSAETLLDDDSLRAEMKK